MKILLTLLATHVLVFAGALTLTAAPIGVAAVFSGVSAASILAFGWLDLSRRIEPLRVRAEVLRPHQVGRPSGLATVRSRRAA